MGVAKESRELSFKANNNKYNNKIYTTPITPLNISKRSDKIKKIKNINNLTHLC